MLDPVIGKVRVAVLGRCEVGLVTALERFSFSLQEVERRAGVFVGEYVLIAFKLSRIFFVHYVSGLLGEEVDIVVVCLGEDVATGYILLRQLFGCLQIKFVCTHILSVFLFIQIQWGVEIDELRCLFSL